MAVETELYDGPLDLLLEEVKRQRVAIERIAMAPIVARFLEYMRTAARRNLALDMEWLHMAATLIEWKSQALLPVGTDEQPPADPIRDDLVRQLMAHKRRAAAELGARQSVEGARLSRVPEAAAVEGVPEPAYVTVRDMMQQARDLGRWVEEHGQARRQWNTAWGVERDVVSVVEMIEYLRSLLEINLKLDGVALLQTQETASRRSCLFLGMLEMARAGECEIEQNESFGDIWLIVSQT
jgi:segregation and condensation protein A